MLINDNLLNEKKYTLNRSNLVPLLTKSFNYFLVKLK